MRFDVCAQCRRHGVTLTHVEGQAPGLATQCANFRGHLFGGFAPCVIVDHDVIAIARQAQRDGPANAAAGPGDQHRAAHGVTD